jgi:hypothetical protein
MSDHYRYRVSRTFGCLYGVVTAKKRHRCDGHMASETHWIEPGQKYVASALPPDSEIGNTGWWHARFCVDCAPDLYADELATDDPRR